MGTQRPETGARVLIVGSLGAELGDIARIARAHGARVEQAIDANDALRRLRGSAAFTLLFCDARDIAALIEATHAAARPARLVACGRPTDARPCLPLGVAVSFLERPVSPAAVAALLRTDDGDAPIAGDVAMLAALRRVEQVAPTDASVLITGESGCGKEVLARHIHRLSRRAGGPFVALNCAAVPEALLESELFGHERGAFSGALARRVGKFEAAHGGTLLLDEISEMDARLQAKLLRAVQEREVDRLGGNAPVPVDVRILATTNRDIAAEVARGNFRLDLYFRLNVVTLRIPSLRERAADIGLLARHFAGRHARANGLPDRPVTEAALRRLAEHGWPGNVRELENTMHRAVLLARGDAIDIDAIELDGHAQPHATLSAAASTLAGRRIDEVERDLILQTLRQTLGNRTQAATLLGISIRALRNKLRDYAARGIAVPPPPSGVAFAALAAA